MLDARSLPDPIDDIKANDHPLCVAPGGDDHLLSMAPNDLVSGYLTI